MEQYHAEVRFVLTCNYPNKIIPAIHSRCQGFHFSALDLNEFTVRIASILDSEGVAIETEADIDILNSYVELTHPDLRKCINLLQQNTRGNKLQMPKEEESSSKDWLYGVIDLFKAGQFLEARKFVVSKASPEDYDDIYRFMYTNLALWGKTQDQQNEALLVICKGLANHALVGDVEINLAATFVQLEQITH
jgi:DNA polymerase III delta prime subunit